MAKHASKFAALQVLEPPRTMSVQVPLPMLDVLADAHNAFFDLCVDVGQQVFSTLMEQDREVVCGPKGQHDPARRASRAGSTSSDITLGGRRIAIRRLRALFQRCQVHKRRNILEHLPERMHPSVDRIPATRDI